MTGRTRVLAAAILGSSLASIDGSAVNVALSAIQGGLTAGTATMQWLLDACLLPPGALALLVPGSLAVIGVVMPAEERGAAVAAWSGAAALTTAFGALATIAADAILGFRHVAYASAAIAAGTIGLQAAA